MIFNPDTEVRLCHNIPLDNSYSHTLYFPNKSVQAEYFLSKVLYSFENFTYQRHDPSRGKISEIRVPIIADEIYNCNYLMFRNKTFSTKWFYAFIRKIDFINDNVTAITYELDIVQTWFFNFTIHPSFVVREHVNSDNKYEHLVEEGLEFGEHVIASTSDITNMNPETCWIVIAASFSPMTFTSQEGGDETTGIGAVSIASKTLGYMFNGIYYYAFDDADKAETFISNATLKALSSGIINIFMFPKPFWPLQQENPVNDKATPGVSAFVPYPTIQTVDNKCNQAASFQGYVPKNNKLFNYPYNYCLVSNCQGGFASFMYEYFGKPNPTFAVSAALSSSPDFALWPMDYKGIHSNWNEAVGLGSYPMCSFTTDSYKAYLAQNAATLQFQKTDILVKGAQSAANGVASAITAGLSGNIGGVVSGIMGTANAAIDTGMNVYQMEAMLSDKSLVPPQANTHMGNETGFSLNLRNFHFYNMTITKEFAQRIDEYFDMFGYKINKIKVPNLTGRKSWNYVKTSNVQITGDMPVDDISMLCKIFDLGITFWHTDDVGNYTLPNNII